MKSRFLNAIICIIVLTACAPQEQAAPTIDIAGTMAVEIAQIMQTQTAEAPTATPPPPTETFTPAFTNTPSEPPTQTPKPQPPVVVKFAGCYKGPGENYGLISNIDPSIRKSGKQLVNILGVGSEPGWIVIENPYFHNPCWIRIENMEIGRQIDLSKYKILTPPP
ncbi:MAG: hypothetical protein OZ914_04520 [Anaerolineaceae bacterium]|nr:hypothetical protein [Anaerolineaceae bacterium]